MRISYLTVRGGGTHGLDIQGGTTEITDAIVQDNTAGEEDDGGGMFIYENATVIVRRTAVVENCAPQAGGGIANAGDLFVYDSLIADNIANRVGGIYNDGGILNLRNTTRERQFRQR